MSSRLPISASSRSAFCSIVASRSASSSSDHDTSVCRRLLTDALIEASGVRRSWLTAASSAVRIRLPSASASAWAAWVRSRSRSSEAAAWAAYPAISAGVAEASCPVISRVRSSRISMRVAASRRSGHVARGDPDPGAARPFGQFGLAAVGAGQVLQDGGRRVGPAEHGLRQFQQRGRLLPGRRGLDRAPRGQVDHAADGDRDRDEQQQGQQVRWLGDGEGMQRLGEVPVEQQAGRHRGEHGGPEPADHRDGHHRDQVDEQVIGQVQVRPGGRQGQRQQREPGRGQQRAAHPPPEADRGIARRHGRGGRAGHAGHARRRGPGARGHAPVTSPARIPAHAYQCEPSGLPAEHQAQDGASQGARGQHDGRVRGGRPGGAQLRVRRPGEPGRGEPADAGQQDRRDRLGRERHGAAIAAHSISTPAAGRRPCRAAAAVPTARNMAKAAGSAYGAGIAR